MIVTVDEVKTHLRIQHSEEDDYLSGLIAQAQAAAKAKQQEAENQLALLKLSLIHI